MKLPSLRSLTTLYKLDRPFARLANFAGIMLMGSITLGWAHFQMKSFITVESAGIDTHAIQWAAVAGITLVPLSFALLLRRHHWLFKVVTEGTIIKGQVQRIEVHTTRLPAEKHAPWTPRLSHTYSVIVAYECGGVTRQTRLKLPSLPGGDSLPEGAAVDLLVLPSTPGSPLLRQAFENWARNCGQGTRKKIP